MAFVLKSRAAALIASRRRSLRQQFFISQPLWRRNAAVGGSHLSIISQGELLIFIGAPRGARYCQENKQ